MSTKLEPSKVNLPKMDLYVHVTYGSFWDGHSCTHYWSCILYSWMEEMMGPISTGLSCPCSIFGNDPS